MSRIVLLDECSNVGTRLAEDLLATGARVIACGDPGQLPPVRDQQFFSEPDLTLTEVHRQAWDSAIIRQAHAVRSIGSYAADGVDFRVVDRASEEDLYRAGVALCWRNATRKLLNERRRAVMGHRGRTLRRGEPLMCLKNDHALKLYNGAIYELMNDREPGDDFEVTNDTGGCVTVMCPTVEGFDARFEEQRYDDACLPFALAYGATVHKAQGSEWDEVLLVDEMDSCADRRAMLYTGVTRAAKRITVVRR